MRTHKLVVAAAASGALLVGLSSGVNGGVVPAFVIDPVTGVHQAGGSFTVSGEGCPPTGDFSTETPLGLQLVPPGVGHTYSPVVEDGEIRYFTTLAYHAGLSGAVVTPEADGSFEAVIPIPENAPSGAYTVWAWCTALLEPGETARGISDESLAAAETYQGNVTIQAAPTPTTAPPTPTNVVPAFTG